MKFSEVIAQLQRYLSEGDFEVDSVDITGLDAPNSMYHEAYLMEEGTELRTNTETLVMHHAKLIKDNAKNKKKR